MSTKSITKQKARTKGNAHQRIIQGIQRMENTRATRAKVEMFVAWNLLLAAYCKFHGDKLGREVAQADVKRICGIKGDL